MSVKWTAVDNTIEGSEGTSVDKTFTCYVNPEDNHNIRINTLSTTLPEEIKTEIVRDNGIITGFRIYGTLPSIASEEIYYITARLEEYKGDTVYYYSDKYFKVVNQITELSWTRPLYIDCYDNTEFSFSLKEAKYEEGGEEKYYINGLNGDEIFRKVSGTLPKSVALYSNGIISGTPSRDDVNQTFEFGIALYRNDELVLPETPVHITVKEERKDIPPTWITESGILDTINAGEVASNIKVIAIINSDETDLPEERKITYTVVNGELPSGLSLYGVSNQGLIEGTLTTSDIKDWEFTIRATRIYAGRTYSDDRTFWIKTNEASPEHRIDWNGDDKVIDVGSYSVGSIINQKIPEAIAADGTVVRYAVVDNGTFPSSIRIESDGSLIGKAELPKGVFECSVRAYTDYTYITKTIRIRISKGLSQNALDLSLRLNLEFKDEFLELKNQLNSSAGYGTNKEGYNVDLFPSINIATLSCFDREVLAGIFNFGAPEIIRFLETRYKTYSDVDMNGDPIETYEAYYKAIDENTYQWDEIKNGNFDFQSQLNKEIEQTNEFSGSTDNPYFYPMEKSYLTFNNETAEPDPTTQKQWVIDSSISSGNYYKIGNVNIATGLNFKIFNIKNVRKALQKNIYVYQKMGDYYYDLGNQQLFNKIGIPVKKLYFKTYMDMEVSAVREKYYMSNMDGSNEEEVIYTYQDWNTGHYVYNLDDVLQRDILFKPTFDTHPFMISSDNDEVYYLEEITNPYCFDFNKEENKWISMDKIPEGKEMVLPRITEDDLEDDGESFIMLDTSVEPLPKWKRKEYKYWEAETTYEVGDIVYYNSIYYMIIKEYTTGYGFEYNTEYMRELDPNDVKEKLSKEYIPSLDLGYYKSGKNRAHLNNLNDKEKQGLFWYKKDFMFWEITCTPIYNSTIETFGVPFYSTQIDKEEKESCTFELIVNVNNYTASLIIDGINIISSSEAIQRKYKYVHTGNSYKVTVDNGTVIKWRVSDGEEYFPLERKESITSDIIREVTLPKKIDFTVNTIPSDSKVTLTYEGQSYIGNTITVPEGANVIYKVEHEGYHTATGTHTVSGASSTDSIEVELLSVINVILRINTVPDNATVIMNALGETYVSNEITVPKGTRVTYTITKSGYVSVPETTVTVNDNKVIEEVLKKWCTYEIITVPDVANVVLTAAGYTQIGKSITVPEGTNVTYTVSKPNYKTVGPITVPVNDNQTNTVRLELEDYEFRVNVLNVDNPRIVLKYSGIEIESDHVTVPYGTTVAYTVTKEHYENVYGSALVLSNKTEYVRMTEKEYTLTVETDPSYSTVTLRALGETIQGKTISVPYNTTVIVNATCTGYFPSGDIEVLVEDNMTKLITLESTTFSYNLIDEEGNGLLSEINNKLISETYEKEHPINNNGD